MNLRDEYLQGLTTLPVPQDETPREGDVLTVIKDADGNHLAAWQPVPSVAQQVGTEDTNIFLWDSNVGAWFLGHGFTAEELATVGYAQLNETTGAWELPTGELVDPPSYLQQYDSYTKWEIIGSGFNVEGGSIILDGTAIYDTLTLTPQANAPVGMGKGTIYYDSDDDSVYVQVTD